ncbi:MAG TPA: hypothetical protein VLB44_05775 [Kofleriaceae bacterium]|nr:hypothetical protein [Kofleriaceae bacterium]
MRTALVCVAMLVAARAFADEPAPAPAPPSEPQPEAPQPAPEPKPDPAYGEKPDPADGGGGYFAAPKGHDYTIKAYPDRTKNNILTLSIMGGASIVLGGIGLYFHLDSRDRSDQLSAHRLTGLAWTPDLQSAYDDAHRSATLAGVFYGVGGALLLGTAIAYIATEPKQQEITVHPHIDAKPTALVAPLRGGALVGGTWSF